MKEFVKKNKKKIIIGSIIIIILIAIIILSTVILNKNESKTPKKDTPKIEENTNKNVISETTIDGFKIDNIKVEIIDGLTTFTADATNITEEVKNIKGFNIYFTKTTENDMGMISVYTNEGIEPGATFELINYSDLNLKEATSIKYEIIYE